MTIPETDLKKAALIAAAILIGCAAALILAAVFAPRLVFGTRALVLAMIG